MAAIPDPEKESKSEAPQLTTEDQLGVGTVYGDETHRRLKGRHIQLIGIGGTIGTVLFVCLTVVFCSTTRASTQQLIQG